MEPFVFSVISPLWGAGAGDVVNVIIVLLFVVAPFIKSIYDSVVEARREAEQKKAKQLGQDVVEYLVKQQEEQEEVALAEPVRQQSVLQSSLQDSQERFESLPSQKKEKRKPKIRPKNKSLTPELVDQSLSRDIAASIVHGDSKLSTASDQYTAQTAPASSPPRTRQAQGSPLAASIVKMLQDPNGVRQAIVISEILKRPTY